MAGPAASAQSVLGLGDDAAMTPAGNLRLRIQSEWTYYDQRFVSPGGGTGSGSLQPLGAPFTLDTLGASRLPALRPLQDSLRAIAGVAGINVSLGSTVAQITDRVTRVPLTLEAGLARWLSISATVPLVHTRSSVFFRANQNPAAGNLGINPALGGGAAHDADTLFAQQIIRSATAVQSYCAGAGAGTAQCSSAAALATSATSFGRSVAVLYGAGQLVPIQTSTLQGAVDTRAASFRSSLNAFAAIPGSGVPSVTANGVVGAPLPLATPDVQMVLSDPSFGVQLDQFQTIEKTHLGDIEVAAKILLLDSFHLRNMTRFNARGLNTRLAVGAGYRLPTGELKSPDNLTDISTGTHAGALLLRGYGDVMIGSHFWTSFVARYIKSSSDNVVIRYAPTNVTFPLASSRVSAQRQLGAVVEIEATPRWEVNDFFSIGGQYQYRHKPLDTYTASAPSGIVVAPGDGPLDPSFGSAFTEHRIGGGVGFSNSHAVSQGRSHIPFDVSYLHTETISGSGGIVPKLITDQIVARIYYRVRR